MLNWSYWETRFARFLEPRLHNADPAHDMAHVNRVVATARHLALSEGAALEVVIPAAWLHDCVVTPKNSARRNTASTEAAQEAVAFLAAEGYPQAHYAGIAHAIAAHSFSAGIAPRTIEAKVVQDADRLDALGAIGIARCMMVGGALGRTLYHTTEPFPILRAPDDHIYTIDHFFVKLLKLVDTMQTAAGRAEAQRRTQFITDYLRQLQSELAGKMLTDDGV